MEKPKLLKVILQFFVLVLFVLLTSATLFYALGYKYDRQKLRLIATGIVSVPQHLSEASLYLDGKKMSDDLPDDVQYLLPGKYFLEIRKKNFFPWEKNIEVFSGRITEVLDVVLVPRVVDRFLKIIKIGVNGSYQVFVGKDYFGVFDETGLLSLHYLKSGQVVSHKFDFGFGSNVRIYSLMSGDLLLQVDELRFKYLSLSDFKLTKAFVLPEGAYGFRVFGEKGFYLINGDLFSFDLPLVNSDEFIPIVGDFYFGGLKGFEILDLERGIYLFDYLNSGKVFGYLDVDKQIFNVIDENIREIPKVSYDGNNILYQKGTELWVYDVEENKSRLLTRFSLQSGEIQWYLNSNHLLFVDGKKLKLCDLEFDNCYALFEVDEGERIYSIDKEEELIFRKDGNFYGLDLSFGRNDI